MLNEKYRSLIAYLRELGSAAVAFSGGVDSAFLLAAAQEALGEMTAAITVDSPAFPRSETDDAKGFCAQKGIRHIIIKADIMDIPAFRQNPHDRCYHCKKAILSQMISAAEENGFGCIAEGSNADDDGDYRPGMKAVSELGVKSPLKDIGFTKAEIRELSRKMGLPTADKPSYACLATRIPYGEEITEEKLNRIERSEKLLHELGFLRSRVRVHGDLARIEIIPEEFYSIMKNEIRRKITEEFKKYGFVYVSLDMQGYRTGSMNETLTEV